MSELPSKPHLWTISKLAKEHNAPISQIEYVLRTRSIPHILMAGNCRLFDEAGADAVRKTLKAIKRKKNAEDDMLDKGIEAPGNRPIVCAANITSL